MAVMANRHSDRAAGMHAATVVSRLRPNTPPELPPEGPVGEGGGGGA